jgi:hypothetical protein
MLGVRNVKGRTVRHGRYEPRPSAGRLGRLPEYDRVIGYSELQSIAANSCKEDVPTAQVH